MRSTQHRLRNTLTVAALAVLGGTVGLSTATAAQATAIVPIQPHQAFVGQVNGATIGAVVTVGCFGPVSANSVGHPISGQSVSVEQVSGSTPAKATVGYTGESADHVLVGFSNSTSAAATTEIKAYDVAVPIPQDIYVPCFGAGTVGFVPGPTSPSAQAATVDVTFVSVGATPGS